MTEKSQWPNGATVRLTWAGYGPYEAATGWAKRDAEGRLISVYSRTPLDPDVWKVVEERQEAAQPADITQPATTVGQQLADEAVAYEVVASHPSHGPHKHIERDQLEADRLADHWRTRGCSVAVRALVYGADATASPMIPEGWRKLIVEAAKLLLAIDKNDGLMLGGEQYPNGVDCIDVAVRLRALLVVSDDANGGQQQ